MAVEDEVTVTARFVVAVLREEEGREEEETARAAVGREPVLLYVATLVEVSAEEVVEGRTLIEGLEAGESEEAGGCLKVTEG